MRRLNFAVYDSCTQTTPKKMSDAEWENLCVFLSKPAIREAKDGHGISFVKLDPATRANANVQSLSAALLDIDDGTPYQNIQSLIQQYEHLAYSTYNHTSEHPKYRLLFPLSRDVSPGEWPAIWHAMNKLIGEHADPACKDVSHFYYLPSHPAARAGDAFSNRNNGEWIDPDRLLPMHLAISPDTKQMMDSIHRNTSPSALESAENIVRVKSALDSIPAGCPYEQWRAIIWAVASTRWSCAEELARTWSATAPDKFTDEAFTKVWHSFNQAGGINLGTLYHHAKEAGWADMAVPVPLETIHGDTSGDIKNGKLFAAMFRDKLLSIHETNDVLMFDENMGWLLAPPGESDRAGKEVVARMRAHAAEQWKAMPDDPKTKRLMAHVERSSSEQKISAMFNMAKSESGMTVRLNELDADTMMLGVANGVLNLRTGALLHPSPSLRITKRCPVPFDPGATAPILEAFITRITQGDPPLAKFLQRLAGYTLTGEVNEQCFAFLYGLGRNGKTTYAELLFWLLGDYAVVLPTATLMMGKRDPGACSPDLMLLKGRRLALASELEESARFAEAAIKSMTGGDTMTARNPYGTFASWTPTHKLMIVGNHRPIISGGDHGIWRRVRLIPFSEIISDTECDSRLQEKLRAEGAGVLNWALAGLRDWQQQELNPPASVKAAVVAYHSDMDILGEWLDDHTGNDPNARTETALLYRAYEKWAKDSGWKNPMTRNSFGRRLTDRGIITSKASNGIKCAHGICLNAEGLRAVTTPWLL